MKTYDTPAATDPFTRSRIGFESLAEELASGRAREMTHDQLEELIETRGRELERQLLQDHFDLRALREEQALAAGRDQRRVDGRGRIERGHERMLATVFGPVTVRRLAFRAPGRPNVCPADVALSLPAGRHSHGLRRAAVCEAVRGSYDTAKTVLDRRCGHVAGKRQIEQLVQAAAAGIDAFYAQRVPMPRTSEVLLVISADGKGIVMRPEGLRPATRKAAEGKKRGRGVFRTRLASGEKPCRKRMAALACVHDAAPAPRRPHDVIAVPGGRSGEREPRRGPHATAKWLTGSVACDAKEVIRAAFDQAEAAAGNTCAPGQYWSAGTATRSNWPRPGPAAGTRRSTSSSILCTCWSTCGPQRGASIQGMIRQLRTGWPSRRWRCWPAVPGMSPSRSPRRPMRAGWPMTGELAWRRACAT
jgi:hypothetical protein